MVPSRAVVDVLAFAVIGRYSNRRSRTRFAENVEPKSIAAFVGPGGAIRFMWQECGAGAQPAFRTTRVRTFRCVGMQEAPSHGPAWGVHARHR
jgi:hypothetical protein